MSSFEMFKRCSLAQWRGYPEQVRLAMGPGDPPENGLFALAFASLHPSRSRWIWMVEGLPAHQGTLMKVILE